MVRLLDRAGLSALSERLALVPLAAHKGLDRGRWLLDQHGGYGRAEGRAATWAAAWADRWGKGPLPLARWLERPGGGRLWIGAATGARWARRRCSQADISYSDEVIAGRIPLLGAAPDVGNPPQWRRDGYTAREWALSPGGGYVISRGDGSDIRTVWELSRCYHFVPLAKAYWRTGDARYAETFRAQVDSWLGDNPVGAGPNWCSPMDSAIRGANWALAAALFSTAPAIGAEFWGRLLANLRLTARFIERHLEWHPLYRGNHYVSNGVGLVYLGALFRDEPGGDRWLRLGARILQDEIARQVYPDGVSFEASIGYHRLVTEFFARGGRICRQNLPGILPEAYWQRLDGMYQFVESYLDSAGRAPLLGDADDGRLHLLFAEAAEEPRLHRLGLPLRKRTPVPAASRGFPQGGFYVLRAGDDRCIVRCGPVGLAGAGSHDHNDQLSYELVLGGREVVADSGTYAYTRDLAARYAFRSTSAHNVVQVGGEEQNPIRIDRPWRVLADRTRAECLEWSAGPTSIRFAGRHSGFSHRPSGVVCRRAIALDLPVRSWSVEDLIEGRGRETLAWRLHFAPGALQVTHEGPGRYLIYHDSAPAHEFHLAAPADLAFAVEESLWSERYGIARMRPVAVLRGEIGLPVRITLHIRPTERIA